MAAELQVLIGASCCLCLHQPPPHTMQRYPQVGALGLGLLMLINWDELSLLAKAVLHGSMRHSAEQSRQAVLIPALRVQRCFLQRPDAAQAAWP